MVGNLLIQKEKEAFSILNFGIEDKESYTLLPIRQILLSCSRKAKLAYSSIRYCLGNGKRPGRKTKVLYKRFYPGAQEESGGKERRCVKRTKVREEIRGELRGGSELQGGRSVYGNRSTPKFTACHEFCTRGLRIRSRSARPRLSGRLAVNRTSAETLGLLAGACT
jgi:hypothetical protein